MAENKKLIKKPELQRQALEHQLKEKEHKKQQDKEFVRRTNESIMKEIGNLQRNLKRNL